MRGHPLTPSSAHTRRRGPGRLPAALALLLCACGCRPPEPPARLRARHAAFEARALSRSAPVPQEPLTLQAAVDFALKHNLDLWAARQERELQAELSRQSRLRMLPSLMAQSELEHRTRYPANTSVNLKTGQTSLAPSYAEDKNTRRFNLALAWNLLDFGVSYLRSQQAADQARAVERRWQRQRQTLRFQVARAYWRVLANQRLAAMGESIDQGIGEALAALQASRRGHELPAKETLEQEALLLEERFAIRKARERQLESRRELAQLLGLAPEAAIKLVPADFDRLPPARNLDPTRLERLALHQRPELFEQDLRERRFLNAAKAEIARMFPGPALFLRADMDRNPLLYYREWYSTGLQVTWDLLSLPAKARGARAARAQAELARRRRLALVLGIITQVHVAVAAYRAQIRNLELLRAIAGKRRQVVKATARLVAQGQARAGANLAARIKHFHARSRFVMAYANVATAAARIEHALGAPLPETGQQAGGDDTGETDRPALAWCAAQAWPLALVPDGSGARKQAAGEDKSGAP